jgi:hypothetical protein
MKAPAISGPVEGNLTQALREVMRRVLPWVPFLALLVWAWPVDDLFHTIPSYQDALEVLWGIEWYGAHFPDRDLLFYPLLFHPEGWHVATFAYGPAVFLPLLPLFRWGGAAFAYNTGALLSLFVAFAGMFRLARRFARSTLATTVAALLYTFWGFRWLRIYGHLNVLFGSMLLPWMVWSFDRGCRGAHRRWGPFVWTGVLWGMTVVCSLYFVWLGGLLLLAWGVGCWSPRRERRSALLRGWGLAMLVTGLISAPVVFLYLRGYAAAEASPYDVYHLNAWGASLNGLPLPSLAHPWLAPFATAIYQGPVNESALMNLGLLASAVALLGIFATHGQRGRRSLLLSLGVGLVLALGLTLKWDDHIVQCDLFRPVTALIWRVGHGLKPDLFPVPEVPAQFEAAIPLPGLLLSALLPFWEGARTLSRFAFVAAPAFFIFVARGVERFRSSWVPWTLAVFLVLEIVPAPTNGFPFPPPEHAAFDWVREESAAEAGVLDLYAAFPDLLAVPIRGESLWSTENHRRATVSGTSGVWPGHTHALFLWFLQHPHPFERRDFAPLLRFYEADYVLLHMQTEAEWDHLPDAEQNPALEFVGCFDPPAGPSPWPYPICIVRVLPPASPVELALRSGWSPPEGWGTWALGTRSRARWAATAREPQRLVWEAFPHCVPGESQTLTVTVEDVTLLTHRWDDCEPAGGEVLIPASLVELGWNDIYFHYGYAAQPVEVTDGENPDTRSLSLGFTRLQIETEE